MRKNKEFQEKLLSTIMNDDGEIDIRILLPNENYQTTYDSRILNISDNKIVIFFRTKWSTNIPPISSWLIKIFDTHQINFTHNIYCCEDYQSGTKIFNSDNRSYDSSHNEYQFNQELFDRMEIMSLDLWKDIEDSTFINKYYKNTI